MGVYYVLHNHHDIPYTSERFQPPKRRLSCNSRRLSSASCFSFAASQLGYMHVGICPKHVQKQLFHAILSILIIYLYHCIYIYLYDIIARIIISYNIKWFLKKIPHGFNAWAVRFGAVFGSPSGARLRFWSRGSSGETDGISMYIYMHLLIYIVLYVLFMFAVSVFHGISWWQLVLFGFTFRIFRNLSDFSVFWIYLFNENRNAGVSGLSLFEALKLFKKSQGPNEEDLFLPSSWKSWRYWEEHTISIFINVC